MEDLENCSPCEVALKTMSGLAGKSLFVLEGESDAFVYTCTGMYYWDTCAPEALIRANFGYTSNLLEKTFKYDPRTEVFDAIPGTILTSTKAAFDAVVDRMGPFLQAFALEHY